jgi:DNA primase
MPKTDREFVDFKAIKQSVSMVQILEHYGLMEKMRRAGDRISGRCPIHKGENQTAFRVSVEKNCWNCFSDCKCGGNVLDFVSKMEGVDILEAALLIKGWFKLTFSERQDERSDRREESRPAPQQPEPPKNTKPVVNRRPARMHC